jgi:hypothetical protein
MECDGGQAMLRHDGARSQTHGSVTLVSWRGTERPINAFALDQGVNQAGVRGHGNHRFTEHHD